MVGVLRFPLCVTADPLYVAGLQAFASAAIAARAAFRPGAGVGFSDKFSGGVHRRMTCRSMSARGVSRSGGVDQTAKESRSCIHLVSKRSCSMLSPKLLK